MNESETNVSKCGLIRTHSRESYMGSKKGVKGDEGCFISRTLKELEGGE